MADLSVTGEVVVTSEKAEAAFDRVGDKATQMANEVASSAGKAGQAVDGIGAGAEKSADKFTRAESRMRDAIKRSTQELQLLGKTASEKLEFNIQAKGLDASKFAPYIEELKKAEQAQKIATSGLDNMGMSAKATAAAMRNVPAQFQDIIVSLQGGQAPMTVFLQQGSQLSSMFGGAGNAAKALGGYVLGLVNPFTVAAAAGVTLAVAYNQGSKEADAYRLAIVSTGNAAGTTGAQLKSYAQEISGVIGTQGKAAESLAAFVSTGRVSRDVLKEASQAAIAWERATGQSVDTTAKQFAELGKDPLQAVLKLNDGTNFLTESVYKQIKSLDEQGRSAEAAAVAQRAYADALTGRSATITQNLGYIEAAWKGITDAAKKGWDAMLNVGRASTPADATAELRTRLMRQQEELAAKKAINPSADTSGMEKGIEILKQRLGLLASDERQQRRLAEAEAQRAAQLQALTDWEKEGAKYLSDKAKLERELTAARNAGLAAGKSQAEIEQRLAQIRDSYAKKGGSTAASENKELRERQRIYAELAGVSSTYYNDLAAAQAQRARGNMSEAEYVKYVEALIQKQPFAVAQEKERAEAIKESAKALGAWYDAREKESQGLQNQINARREEVTLMGMTTEAVAAYTQAKYEQQAAEKEAYAAALESASFYAGEYAEAYNIAAEAARNQAKQLRELGGLEVEKANKDASKKAADEWQRASEKINDTLTDALMRGFESGKDFAKNLRDTVINMFKTMVLRPVISAIVSPVAGAVTGMMGLSGAAQAGQGGVGVDSLSSAYQMMTKGVRGSIEAGFSKFATSAAGQSLGLSTAGVVGNNKSAYVAPQLTDTGSQMGAALGVVGDTLAGYAMGSMARSLISGGYSVSKGMDTFQKVGVAVGSALGGPIGGAVIGAAAGVVNRLFGRKLKDSGIQGTFGGQTGFEGESFEFYKGGMFRSDKTKTNPLDEEVRKTLGDAFNAMRVEVGTFATLLGQETSRLATFTSSMKISTKGLDDKAAQEKIQEALATANNELAEQVIGSWQQTVETISRTISTGDNSEAGNGLVETQFDEVITKTSYTASEFAREGEKAIDTLRRLATSLSTVNGVWDQLGNTLLDASLSGGNAASKIADAFGGIDALVNASGEYFQNFYSAEERRQKLRSQLEKKFQDLGLSLPDIDSQTAREQFRALAQAQDLTTDSGVKTYAALLQLSGAFASVTSAVEAASQTANQLEDAARAAADAEAARVAAIDKAYTNLEAAYRREEKVLQARLDGLAQYRKTIEQQYALRQESLGLITGVFDVLRSSVQDLYASVESAAAMQAEQGREFIAQALTAALTTGYLPEQDQLSDAIRAARAGVDSGQFANTAEQDFAKLVLAGQLRALEEVAGKQKTDAEMQLEALQSQLDAIDEQTDAINQQIKLQQDALDYFRDQIDIANGVYDATLSVEDALRAMAAALGLETGTTKPIGANDKPGGGSGGGAVFGGGSGSNPTPAPARYSRLVYGGTAGVGYEGIRDQSLIDRMDKLSPVYHSFDGTGDLVGLAAAFKAAGGTIADLSILSGNWESDWRKAFESVGVPAFAVGTNYVPRDMLAQIHEGEAIVPKAFNPWAGGSMGNDNTALIAELRALRAEVAELRNAAEETAGATGATADVLVRVTQNGNGMVTAAAPI